MSRSAREQLVHQRLSSSLRRRGVHSGDYWPVCAAPFYPGVAAVHVSTVREPGEASAGTYHAPAARSVRAAAQARSSMCVLGGRSVDLQRPGRPPLSDPEFEKEAWLSMVMLEWGVVRPDGGAVPRRRWDDDAVLTGDEPCLGYAFYAPPRAVPRASYFPDRSGQRRRRVAHHRWGSSPATTPMHCRAV